MKRSALASVSLLLTLSTLANTAFGIGPFGPVDVGDLGNIGTLLRVCNIGKLSSSGGKKRGDYKLEFRISLQVRVLECRKCSCPCILHRIPSPPTLPPPSSPFDSLQKNIPPVYIPPPPLSFPFSRDGTLHHPQSHSTRRANTISPRQN